MSVHRLTAQTEEERGLREDAAGAAAEIAEDMREAEFRLQKVYGLLQNMRVGASQEYIEAVALQMFGLGVGETDPLDLLVLAADVKAETGFLLEQMQGGGAA